MDQNKNTKKSIAIIGGGMTGIAAAKYLSKLDQFSITLFEKESNLGGLSTYYQWEDVIWDRFYHVILSTDTVMLNFIHDLELENQLFWRDTRTGFFGNDKLVSMSSTMDFIKFPFMTLWQKFRMGLGILYSSRISNPSKLDRIYVREWLTSVFGRRVYENIWEPLLRSKLGDAREKTSAAFIWATINRLYGARQGSGSSKKEQMGHVHGGYHTILNHAEKRLQELNVKINKNCSIKKITRANNEDIKLSSEISPGQSYPKFYLHTNKSKEVFDNVLVTVDCPETLQLVSELDKPNAAYWSSLENVEYLGVICVFLILKHQLSPYYVINLLDKDLPFTGIIEATNIVSPSEIGNKHIVYLPKYLTQDDPLIFKSDAEISSLFVNKLKTVFPHLDNSSILHSNIFRAKCVQPLQEINFLDRTHEIRTPVPGLYLVNTSMIYNSTLNNNAAVRLGEKAAEIMLKDHI